MENSKRQDALNYHKMGRPGKIQVVPTKPYSTQRDLSLAYSPGVAIPCLEIEKNLQDAYEYTAKGNLVAVISNGTAVLATATTATIVVAAATFSSSIATEKYWPGGGVCQPAVG